MIRAEQEMLECYAALIEVLGENPMKDRIKRFQTECQEHLDAYWRILPTEHGGQGLGPDNGGGLAMAAESPPPIAAAEVPPEEAPEEELPPEEPEGEVKEASAKLAVSAEWMRKAVAKASQSATPARIEKFTDKAFARGRSKPLKRASGVNIRNPIEKTRLMNTSGAAVGAGLKAHAKKMKVPQIGGGAPSSRCARPSARG